MTNSIPPNSPWSRYFYSSTLSSSASSYSQSSSSTLSSFPTLSRPCSQMSESSLSRLRSPSPWSTSYPTTPLSSRSHHDDITHQPSPPLPSPYRSRHNQTSSPTKQGVYHTLYSPDIINLSSSREGRGRWEESLDDDRYSPERVNLKMPWSEDTVHSNSYFETSFANKLSEEYKQESSNMNDDHCTVCDELLEELNADHQHYKFSPELLISNTKSFTKTDGGNKREELYNNKIKKVELSDLDDKVVDLKVTSDSSYHKPLSNNGHKTSHEEYFDNLLMIIEKAAQGLTL